MDLNIENLTQSKFKMTKVVSLIMQKNTSSKVEAPMIEDDELEPAQRLYKCLVKENEAAVLNLIKLIEQDVSEDVIKDFCKEADHSPMYMVRIYLH